MQITNNASIQLCLSKNPSPVFLVTGEIDLLKNELISAVFEHYAVNRADPFALAEMDMTDTPFDIFCDACTTLPLMGVQKAVLAKNFDLSQLTDSQLSTFASLTEQPLSGLLLVVRLAEPIGTLSKEGSAFLKKADAQGIVYRCDVLKGRDFAENAEILTKEKGCSIAKTDAEYLLEICGGDATRAFCELEKLCSYRASGEIIRKDIYLLVEKTLEQSVFDLIKAMQKKEYIGALTLLGELKERKEEPIAILNVLALRYLDLFRAKETLTHGQSANDMNEAFAYKGRGFAVSGALREARELTSGQIQEMVDLLIQTDLQLKSTTVDGYLLLEWLIARLFMVEERTGS